MSLLLDAQFVIEHTVTWGNILSDEGEMRPCRGEGRDVLDLVILVISRGDGFPSPVSGDNKRRDRQDSPFHKAVIYRHCETTSPTLIRWKCTLYGQ